MQSNVYIVGFGMTQFGRHLDRAIESLANEAFDAALTDAGATRSLIEQVYYSGATQGALQGQYAIPGQVVLSKIGLTGLTAYKIENACASGTTGFQLAVQSLRATACWSAAGQRPCSASRGCFPTATARSCARSWGGGHTG